MLVVTYSEARRTLASVLDRAKTDGSVLIKRADGSVFKLTPVQNNLCPFEGISTDIKLKKGELTKALEEARRASEEHYGT